VKIEYLAGAINLSCNDRCYLLACLTVKDTIELWENPDNYNLLCDKAQDMANHYLNDN